MSLFPDKSSDQRKEEILQRSPFLRTFLDTSAQMLNPEKWEKDVKEYGDRALEDMTAHLGNAWYKLTVMPLVINTEVFKILNPETPDKLKFSVVPGIVAIGFEVGDKEGVNLVTPDIVQALVKDRSFNPRCQINKHYTENAVDFIYSLLAIGVYLKGITPDNNEDRPKQPANPFDDFINGLDLKGI